ncbi:ParA family protein [Algiphilus sp.]|uniref:ParA family protein n=1 Tax=Algiphilus sp. TaxID=1872431 RepID=UPI0025B96B82|nr:ParA family protein [Algiphilus sp.]MCK5771044.1 ParA family protein [Algiphilus sp.]
MSVWTVANQKGGVGKTTTAVTLAGIAAERGFPCLLIDLDPHASATHYLRAEAAGGAEALLRGTPTEPCATAVPGIRMLGASAGLAAIERQQGAAQGMGRRLAQGLAPLRTRFDPIILDTPPMLGTLLVNALAAADALIVPVQTDPLALHGLEGLMRTVEMMRKAGAGVPEPIILPTLMDRRVRISHETLAEMRKRWGAAVFDGGVVPMDTRIREAARDGRPLNTCAPYRHATATYEALFERLHPSSSEAA